MNRTPYQVLLVEDNPGDAELAHEFLGATPTLSFDVYHVGTLASALEALHTVRFDAVLLDLNLPDSWGLKTIDALRDSTRGCPIVVLSSLVTEDLRTDAIRHGAEDVFDKMEAATRLFSRAILYVVERNHARARQRQIEALHDAAPDAILFFDGDGVVRYANRTARVLFDHLPGGVVGERVASLLSAGESSEVTILREDGPHVCEVRVVPFSWEERTGSLASLRDVTTQRQSETRLRRLAESGVLGVATANLADGTILNANEAFFAMLGFARDARALPLSWRGLIPAAEVERVGAIVAHLRATGSAAPFEVDLVRQDGTDVRVLVVTAMLDDVRCAAFLVDVSARRRAEEAQKKAEATLRTTEAQLRTAQKMEAIGRLAGGISHDFNNILSVILTCVDSALRSEAKELVGPELKEICEAAERGAELIRQLVTFSHQSVGETRVIEPVGVVRGMTGLLRRLVGNAAELVIETPAAISQLQMDPARLEQILMNLVINARDAVSRDGRIEVTLHEVVLDEVYAQGRFGAVPGRYVMLTVTDDGIGMDPETQSRIFEPFFTTKAPGKGTGLGLATVFGIVQQAGGHVDVRSIVGHGSTFLVYLPAVAEDVRGSGRVNLGGTETILLVEDDDKTRSIASEVLAQHGYRVIEAQDAAQALEWCDANEDRVDLLLTDVVMRQMTGPELARRLHGDRVTRVLCMSGYAKDAMFRHGFVLADMPFLQKPFTPEGLARRVREVLDGGVPRTLARAS